MTPQEQELIKGLFDRLSQLESQARDPAAERLIAQGLARAPSAIYTLVQTVLVQDEALKLANARIEELQAQRSADTEPEQRPTSFLDSMRAALGGRAPRGSVPSVGTAGGQQPVAPGFGAGGSFLGTAASTAAGVIGGSLLLDGIRSLSRAGASAADREQDRQQDLADDDREQDAEQDLADDDAQQDSEQDLMDDEDFADEDDFFDDDHDA